SSREDRSRREESSHMVLTKNHLSRPSANRSLRLSCFQGSHALSPAIESVTAVTRRRSLSLRSRCKHRKTPDSFGAAALRIHNLRFQVSRLPAVVSRREKCNPPPVRL